MNAKDLYILQTDLDHHRDTLKQLESGNGKKFKFLNDRGVNIPTMIDTYRRIIGQLEAELDAAVAKNNAKKAAKKTPQKKTAKKTTKKTAKKNAKKNPKSK